jgi:hypothetical protein
MEIGDTAAARTLAARAAALARKSSIPHREASTLYCRGLLDHDGLRLLRAADRYSDACRPLLAAKALEAAAAAFLDGADRVAARAAYTRALDLYTSLGAARDVVRPSALSVRRETAPAGAAVPCTSGMGAAHRRGNPASA